MLKMNFVVIISCCFLLVHGETSPGRYDEETGRSYLRKINSDLQVKTTESVLASWAYESNITDDNLKNQLDVSAKLANFTKEIWKETVKYPWQTFQDSDVRRQFKKFSVLGTAILPPEKYKRYNKIISDMQSIYGKAKICNYHNRTDCTLQLEPELTEIFTKSRDPDELRYYWKEWRNAAGKPVREMYKEYVDLSNEAATLNNFTNNAEFWLKDYEAEDFKEQVESLWQQLRPLYLQLHAYVRRRLREQYGENHVPRKGCIPAHLLGNMWAQSWGNTFDFTAPYPEKPSMDVTASMVEQGYTPLRMFKLAEEFFTSLNLSPMPDTFWKNSILEKPKDGRDLICHASAWDFYDGEDFRIKQCTSVTMEDLNTVHHEMGHIQYFLQYKNQPLVYKEGSNPGFHEAVGDVMALSVSTPKHLRKIGLLNVTEDDTESEINQLFNMALDKIAFLPFGYLMDQWRWSVFQGKTTEKDYNCKWWKLREKYQGLSPSVIRSESDFDPGAKYHTVGNVPYIRYFVSFVIQFQFHRSLCIAANEFDPKDPTCKPLHKCDIYQSKEAGALLKKMLQMGSSKPWPDAMEVLTGQRKMDASALLDYFATLQTWLERENKRTGEYIGWETCDNECQREDDTEKATSSSDVKGRFEDEDIPYSYAEFVRQDDNSFEVSDYLEEVKPSYHPLFPSPRENEFQTNYIMPQTSRLKEALEKKSPRAIQTDSIKRSNEWLDVKEGDKSTTKNTDSLKEAFVVRSKDRQLEKAKILNAILNSLCQQGPNKDFDFNKSNGHRGFFKGFASKSKQKSGHTIDAEESKPVEEDPSAATQRSQNLKPMDNSNVKWEDQKWNSVDKKYENDIDTSGYPPKDKSLPNVLPNALPHIWVPNENSDKSRMRYPSSSRVLSTKNSPRLERFKKRGDIPGNSKRSANLNNDVHLMLVEHVWDKSEDVNNNRKKYVKKAYKEYHLAATNPVVYNAVVITAGGKNDKSDDSKARSVKFDSGSTNVLDSDDDSPALKARRQRNARVHYSPCLKNSVDKNLININNRFQYSGLNTSLLKGFLNTFHHFV